jgi:chromosome segregation ATPase
MSYLPLKSDTDDIMMSIDNAKEKVSQTVDDSKNTITEKISQAEDKIKEVNESIDNLSNEIASKIAFLPQRNETDDISQKITQMRDEINNAVISNSSEKFEKISSLIVGLSENISNQQQEVIAKFEGLNDKENINVLSDNIKNLEDLFNTNAQNYKVLIFDTVENLKTEFNEKAERINDSIVYTGSSLPSIDEKLGNLQEMNTQFKNSLDAMQEAMDVVNKNIADYDSHSEGDEINNALLELKDSVQHIENSIADFIPRCLGFEQVLNSLLSKDEFELNAQKIDSLCAKGEELIFKITQLPAREEVRGLFDEITEKLSKLSGDFLLRTEEFAANFENLKNSVELYITELKNIGDNASSSNDEKLGSRMTELASIVATSLKESETSINEQLTSELEAHRSKMSLLAENLQSVMDSHSKASYEDIEKLNSSLDEISDIKNRLNEVYDSINTLSSLNKENITEQSEALSDLVKNMSYNIDELRETLENKGSASAIQGNLDSLNYRFDEVFEEIGKLRDSVGDENGTNQIFEKVSTLNSELQLVKSDIIDIMNLRVERILEDINILKSGISEMADIDFENYFANLKIQIELSYLNSASEIKESIVHNREEIEKIEQLFSDMKTQLDSVENSTRVSMPENLELLGAKIDSLVRNIEVQSNKQEIISSNLDLNMEEFRDILSEIKTILGDRFDEFKSARFSDTDDLSDEVLDSIKNEFENSLNSTLNNPTSIASLSETLKNAVIDACEKSLSKLNDVVSNPESQQVYGLDLETKNSINDIKNYLSEEIFIKLENYFAHQESILEKIKSDINSFIYSDSISLEKEKIEEEIHLLKDSTDNNAEINLILERIEKRLAALSMDNFSNDYFKSINDNSQLNIINEIVKAKDVIEFCVTESQGSLNDIVDKLEEISESQDENTQALVNINSKMDMFNILAESDEKIEQTLNMLHSKVDILAQNDNEDFDLGYELEDLKNVLTTRINELKTSNDDERTKYFDECLNQLLDRIENIDKNSKDVKDSIISAIVSVFEQISFVEETEDIKDFLEEKTDEINDKLKEVREQLQQMVTNDANSDYTYTLQDVESDIAKLRIAMNEINSASTEEAFSELSENIDKIVTAVEGMQSKLSEDQIFDLKNDFAKLSDDMVSISARTNKLLLTSDESYKALSDGLDRFGSLIYQLEDKFNFPDTTEISERIEKKIDTLNVAINNAANNDKIFHQVLQYLGEWMDSVSESINSITEKTSEMVSVNELLEELKYKVPEKAEIIEELGHKFEAQELRIDRLEMKLDNILMALEEHSESIVSKKLDKLEKEIAKLAISVEKITSYVDEN